MSFNIKKISSSKAKNLYKDCDNPGKNDCGFYSFAKGLIHIIQNEITRGNTNPIQLDLLNRFSSKSHGYSAKEFENDKINKLSTPLLEKLNEDLRTILYIQYLEEIAKESLMIEGLNTIGNSTIYNQFSEIFYHYHNGAPIYKDQNLLYMSKDVQELASFYANQCKDLSEGIELERRLKIIFLSDLFGPEYKKITELSWKDTINLSDTFLNEEEIKIILQFKQYKILVDDYYDYSLTTRKLTINTELKSNAFNCAQQIKAASKSLHQRIKLIHEDEFLLPDELDPGTLYFQFSTINKKVRIYSAALEQGHDYTTVKAEGLINTISQKYQHFFTNFTSELVIDKNLDKLMFDKLCSSADDTLKKHLLYKQIDQEFLTYFFFKKFGKSIENLNENENLELARVKLLLDTKSILPLTEQEKIPLRRQREHSIQNKFQENSIIKNALSSLTKKRLWLATDVDLNYLAKRFKVHLTILENGKSTPRSQGANSHSRPNLVIDNLRNSHWITQLKIAYLPGYSAKKYAEWVFDQPILAKKEIKNLLLSYTTGFVSFFGRTHMNKALELIQCCDNSELDVASIMSNIRQYMLTQEYNPNSSFLKRFEYLDARYRTIDGEIFNKKDIQRIFADYIHNGYCRNHLHQAQRIVDDCADPDKTIENIIENTQFYVNTHKFNHDSHFIERFEQIKQLKQILDENNSNIAELENHSPLIF
ncbi:MAG: hypothetical protein H0U70_03800 [Tatlockia sp.]|nr:hypothetical protein [Tatlockia sp.]